jgi:hypothetical protein
MSDEWEWMFFIIVVLLAAIFISLVVIFLYHHPFIAGVLVGLIAGIGGTIAYGRLRQWFRTHQIVEVPPPKQ